MGRRDDAGALRQLFVKRQPALFDRVHVGEAMQVKQRRAAAVFQQPNFSCR